MPPALPPEAEAILQTAWGSVPGINAETREALRERLRGLLAKERRAALEEAAAHLETGAERRLSQAADSYTEHYARCVLKDAAAALRARAREEGDPTP